MACVEIREERPEDRDAVRGVHMAAFGGHGTRVAALVEALREATPTDGRLSLVAADGPTTVGHALFTRSLLDAPRRLVEVQVLSPIGVIPSRQRQGVGSMLIEHGVDVLSARGVPLVFLEGSPDYYAGRGFVPAMDLGFRKPSLRIPDAGFQVRLLPAYELWMTGTLVYSQTFWDHDLVGLRDA